MKGNNTRKGNKFNSKNEHDNEINANKELLALEKQLEPTGNSMADFEAWKTKMKELEQKNKGISSGGSGSSGIDKDQTSQSSTLKPIFTTTSSSISEFLKLSKNNNDIANGNESASTGATIASTAPIIETKNEKSETDNLRPDNASDDNGTNKPQSESNEASKAFAGVPLDTGRSSSSRFSSFFSTPASATVNSEEQPSSKTEKPATPVNSDKGTVNTNNPGGSRLMSFFKNSSASSTPNPEKQIQISSQEQAQPQTYNKPDNTVPDAQMMPQQRPNGYLQQPRPQGPPTLQGQPQLLPMQMQTNNTFFRGLLNKNKLAEESGNNSIGPMAPPPGLGTQHQQPNQHQNQQQYQQYPPSMGPPQNLHMGMPPVHMMPPPGMQGFPMQQHQQMLNNSRNKEGSANSISDNKNSKNQNNNDLQQQPQPQPFMHGMAPPPGFPPMQGMPPLPPNFNPNMRMPPNGMLPPPHQQQGFFPPQHQINQPLPGNFQGRPNFSQEAPNLKEKNGKH